MATRQPQLAHPWPAVLTSSVRRLSWAPRFARDFAIVIAVLVVYFLLRGQAPVDERFAFRVTRELIDLEQATATFWEPQIQAVSIKLYAVKEFANFVYAYAHFPVLGAVGVWLWFRGRERFVFMRNVLFISMVFGLLFYYLLPAAPPRLLAGQGYNFGFVDTVFGGNTSVSYTQPSLILNEYAAIPSFHFGWIALASAAIWVNTKSVWLRAFAIVLSVVMCWAIVASANHFFIDMAMGAAVVAFSWYLARRIQRRGDRQAAERALSAPAA